MRHGTHRYPTRVDCGVEFGARTMVSRFFRRYVEYRRVGLPRPSAVRLAWIVAAAGRVDTSLPRIT
jgi:hypothetical protein